MLTITPEHEKLIQNHTQVEIVRVVDRRQYLTQLFITKD
jgi:hypothetical protein